MQLSITQKLVISFVGLTVIVLAGTLMLARWSFAQGFLDYVNALEQSRLQQVAEDLAEMYELRNNSWQQVLDSRLVRQIERSAGQPAAAGPPPKQHRPGRRHPAPASPRRHGPPKHPGSPAANLPPPSVPNLPTPSVPNLPTPAGPNLPTPAGPNLPTPAGPNLPIPPAPAIPGLDPASPLITDEVLPPPSPRGRRRHMPPTSLYDSDGRHLAGPIVSSTAEGQIVVPITLDEVVIGELRTQPRRQLNSTQETEFSQQQLNASFAIALAALLISVLISFVLARALLAPVRRLMSAVNSMANGSYELTLGTPRTDELGELMQNVQRLAQALRESQAARKRWLADISHELRTPVTILAGELEALQSGLRKLDQTQVDSFSEEVQRINKLVDDLYQLALSDMGALRYQFAPLDIYSCAEHAVQTLNQQQTGTTPATAITLTGSSGIIHADEGRLHQLFMNLLRNSLFYTDHPGRIEVDVNVTRHHVLINIDDSPPGVEQAQCARLFEPLYRQDASRSRRKAGAGLGLAICRNIVLAHHGEISASPSTLGGLHVHIRLPRNRTVKEAST